MINGARLVVKGIRDIVREGGLTPNENSLYK